MTNINEYIEKVNNDFENLRPQIVVEDKRYIGFQEAKSFHTTTIKELVEMINKKWKNALRKRDGTTQGHIDCVESFDSDLSDLNIEK